MESKILFFLILYDITGVLYIDPSKMLLMTKPPAVFREIFLREIFRRTLQVYRVWMCCFVTLGPVESHREMKVGSLNSVTCHTSMWCRLNIFHSYFCQKNHSLQDWILCHRR